METDFTSDLSIAYDHNAQAVIISACTGERSGTDQELGDYIRDRQANGYQVVLTGLGLHKFSKMSRVRELYRR